MDEQDSRQYPVREHMPFQRRFWILQRIGWCLLAAIPLLALSGLFGNGPLSNRSIADGQQSIEYERFQRVTRLARLVAHLAPAQAAERRLHLNSAFQRNYEITSILPQPLRSIAGANGLELIFAGAQSGGLDVVIWAHPRAYGTLQLEARLDDGRPLAFSALVYP
jgi:hypothetical protein